MLSGGFAFAENHTPNYCSAISKQVCGHLGHFDKFVSGQPMEFMAHLMVPQNEEVQDFKMDLWMPMHGHGSSPVTLTSKDVNKFWVSDANFVMAGRWLVRMDFVLRGAAHHIEIPVDAAP